MKRFGVYVVTNEVDMVVKQLAWRCAELGCLVNYVSQSSIDLFISLFFVVVVFVVFSPLILLLIN